MSEDTLDSDPIDFTLLTRVFVGEADEILAAMEQSLVALERSPGDADILHAVFRGAHTFKGNAATLGFDSMVEVSHLAEDLLDAVRAGQVTVTPALITLLLRSVDILKAMTAAAATDPAGIPAPDPAHLAALRAAVANRDQGEIASEPAVSEAAPERKNVTLRVALGKLDGLMNVTGEIAIARGRLRSVVSGMKTPSRELREIQEILDRLCGELQDQVTTLRMVPIGPVFQQQMRMARDVARGTGKVVQVRFEGEGVEIDKSVVDQIRDPLVHMVRNAIDHGLEAPDQRERLGKPRMGTILLRAHRDGAMVVIQVVDDGAGLDRKRIVDRARHSGWLTEEQEPTREQLQSFIFTPGFSTAEKVTEISGRGVGMDVVMRNVSALRGTVSVDSVADRGTTVTIRLPLTLAIIDALAVGVGDQTFIVPIDSVIECLDIQDHQLTEGPTGLVDVRGLAVPFLRLGSSLGVATRTGGRRNLLLVRDGERQIGVVVDRLHSRTEAVIKPLVNPLPRMQAVVGATILGDGGIALIVDLPRLVREQFKEAV